MGAVKMAMLMMLCVYLIRKAAAQNTLSKLDDGQTLSAGQYLQAGENRLVMQTDCNLVLFRDGKRVCASKTSGKAVACFFTLQEDGNAVVYGSLAGTQTPIWSTETCCRNDGRHFLVLQEDGRLVLYNDAFDILWASGIRQ